MNIIDYILNNHEELTGVATAIVTACSAIAALTPTPIDDGIVSKLYKVIDFFALNFGKAKDR